MSPRAVAQPRRARLRWQVVAVVIAVVTIVTGSPFGPTPVATAAPALLGSPVIYPTGANPHGIATGDMNGDAKTDLIVTNSHSDSVSILLGTGTGTFAAAQGFTTGARPKSAVVDDFDGDGNLDVASANQNADSASVLLGNGDGTLRAKVDYPICNNGHEITSGDFDEDGERDLAAACWGGSVVSVLLGVGDGTFAPKVDVTSGSATHSLAVADFDGDTHDDLAVANHGADTIGLLLGDGDGGFAPVVLYPVGDRPHSIRAGDLDHDGDSDLAITDAGDDTVSVLLGDGDGTFASADTYAVGSVPKSVAIADLDRDGHPDIIAANTAGNGDGVTGNPGGDVISILLGDGDGTFGSAIPVYVGPTPFAVVTGLFDGDARPDVATADWDGGGAAVLRNVTGAAPPPPPPDPVPFTDIAGSTFRADIEWLYREGITAGCSATRFCPNQTVTRGQMASFLARALDLPAAGKDYFRDDDASPHESNIDRVAKAGITSGCAKARFCPNDPVSRAQMASFLARALDLAKSTKDWFTDDDASPHESNIDRVAKAGITSGCAKRRYCPSSLVTRGQMAAFLHRALGED